MSLALHSYAHMQSYVFSGSRQAPVADQIGGGFAGGCP